MKKGAEAPLAKQAGAPAPPNAGAPVPPRQGIPALPILGTPAPPFERVEDVVTEKTLDTIVTFIIIIRDYIVGPKTP